MAVENNEATPDPEGAPKSTLTSASTRESSPHVRRRKRRREQLDSASSGYVQEHPLSAEGDGDEEIQVNKEPKKTASQNLTRCCPKYLPLLAKKLSEVDKRYRDMIKDQGLDAPLMIQLNDTLPPPTVRNVASCISPEGIMDLKGQRIDLYKLAPCVMGDPNVGDFVQPSLGTPVGQEELISEVKRCGSLNNLRGMLGEIAERNDEKEDAKFMCIYRLVVLGYINNPNTTMSPNLNYLGPLCTGTHYMWCNHSVDGTVVGVTNWRNGDNPTILGNMLHPMIIAADLAILEGDDKRPPKGGYPRYGNISQDRMYKFCAADWEKLRFRPLDESLYIEPYYPPKCGTDVLGTGSSHISSSQPQAVDLDYCQPAKVTELRSRLKLADRNFIDRFTEFLKLCRLEGNAKVEARRVKQKICAMGKNTDCDTHGAISVALAFISANKAILEGFNDKLNQYASEIKEINREMTSGSKKCQCCFTYPPSPPARACVPISCMDLKILEGDAWISNSLIDLYALHLKEEHLLPELQHSAILGKYYIMNAIYFQKLVNNEKSMGELKRGANKMNLGNKQFSFWPLNGGTDHWSLAIIRNEDNQTATIFHMDSFGSHDSTFIFDILEKYAQKVLQIKGDICKKKLKVPQQENLYDCGLFVMYTMKKFIMEYNDSLQFGAGWYRAEDASSLRTFIKELIQANKMSPFNHEECDNAKKWASSFAHQD